MDVGVVVVGEQGLKPVVLGVGEQFLTGVKGAPGGVERVTSSAPMAVYGLLDAAPAAVKGLGVQPYDVERVQYRGGGGQFLGGGGLESLVIPRSA